MKTAAKEHATMAQSRELQRAKAIEERRIMLALVKRHGCASAEEYNALKAEEFKRRGKPIAEFTAAAYRAVE
jgi:hypothetical protein